MFSVPLLLLTCASLVTAKDVFTIGGLFHDDNYQSEMAFKYALERHNMFNHDVEFRSHIEHVSRTDSFSLRKVVCAMVSQKPGIVAIFGPESKVTSPMVRSIAAHLELPHITTNYLGRSSFSTQTALEMHPDHETLSGVIATIVQNMNWKTYMIIYEDNDGLAKLQEVLKLPGSDSAPVMVQQLDTSLDQRPLFKRIKQTGEANIILECKTEHILDVLKQAKEVNMLKYFHNYFLTSLDAHTLDFSILQSRANLTTLRLTDPGNPVLQNTVRDWEMGEFNRKQFVSIQTNEVTTESALMHDAVNFFMSAFKELHLTEPVIAKPMDCENTEKWEPGFRLTTYMKVRPFINALTGTVKFNEWGNRVEFNVQIVEIVGTRMECLATWFPEMGHRLNFTRSDYDHMLQIVENLQKTTVMVSSRIGPPYLFHREPHYEGEVLEGNARFEGYSLDLIDAIARHLNFTYTFFLTEDGAYGSFNKKTKSWNGLIKDLLDRKAHLAICDLTITHDRRQAVDFSLPFMTLGVSILYSKSKPSERNIFAFMEPLHANVWIYIVSAYISVVLLIYLIARMAPGDWENPHPCNQNPEELENVWTLKNCLWLILGSTMSQGCDMLPKGISSRMATSMWWFFILIISSSYTANLAAFLTMDKMAPSIDSAEALSKQTKIKYGTVDGGSTQTFFRESNFSTYARMWTQMAATKPSVFEKNNADGVKRVLTTKNQLYAFLMESSQIEYEVERNCELKQVGGRMDSKGYGIAMPVNSPYRSAINTVILKMQEEGTLSLLKKKWWKERHGGGACDNVQVDEGSSNELKLTNVGGVFLVLGVGVSIAFVFAILEFLWNVHRVALEEKISHFEALNGELRFAIKVWVTEKRTSTESEDKPSFELDRVSRVEQN